ncbi:hypothetical protein Pan153_11680 [Gimesia panareensis]|uniref:Uncharacterized protein n=1 Tax=Gimesia panareensis TaxID=2527978 RepID=A0A518FJK6_9PLAN|nr:hypothetical protein [Gimesia panareensis]QDV16538.1 hypothetical protein Pan153_11680 [Gimesia panareensis]
MSEIMCYGEDGLTLAVVTQHLGKLLDAIRSQHSELDEDEDLSLEDCLVFYRPSFGRRGGPEGASFGEFDAIIATKKYLYLIESKWIRSRIKGRTIKLKENQIRRHQIFEWHRKNWKEIQDWKQFRNKYHAEFDAKHGPKRLAPETSKLGKNLEQVLNLLFTRKVPIQHVILAFYHDKNHEPTKVHGKPVKFRLVTYLLEDDQIEQVFKLKLDEQ